ncbi:complex I subunit 4 family protein [Amnibacterium endophyticum]|uniref:NuoM family protein n=1 Tax=Amnibacterium endophyticum TaxID=2109337 RepID=A0ABW4LGU0_9MICO
MLSVLVLAPLVAAIVLALARGLPDLVVRAAWVVVTAALLALTVAATALALPLPPGRLALEERSAAVPGLGVRYQLGVDGFSLALLLLTGVVFLAVAVFSLGERHRPRQQAALYLFLQATCVGLFTAQDLIVFFLFFDLSIVGIAFSIAGWGHGSRRRSALVFFLYTFAGSIALLLGFIGVYLGAARPTFDMAALAASGALAVGPVAAIAVVAAITVGLAVKTPTVPFHSWLPPAHTDAPTIGSVVLAALLLKMGTYGLVRVAAPILPAAWSAIAWTVLVVGIVSALWGALVALAQTDLKRMIAYTSINHMGYVVMAVGAAGIGGGVVAQRTAVIGALVQMVSHGLTTGALFLLVGVLRDRRGTSELDRFGGLGRVAPRFAALFAIAAFASLGLPGFSGFVAELQIFIGAIGATPVAALALPGIVLTAALLLRALQRVLTGERTPMAEHFPDLKPHETVAIGGLLALSLAIGVVPAPLNGLVEPAAAHLVDLLHR